MEDRFCFKVWDTEAGQFYSDESAEILKLHLRPDGHLGFFSGKTHIGGLVICMCTGLKDKNGKLIFEGDILEKDGARGVVVWSRLEWDSGYYFCEGWGINHGPSAWLSGRDRIESLQEFAEGEYGELRVIGSIYENPELLERKE